MSRSPSLSLSLSGRVLGLDSSSARGTAALVDGGRVVLTVSYDAPQGHAERLLGTVERLLSEAGWHKGQLDRIGVGVGPGSFTGIRIGVALAQGMGLGLDRPVLGVGALRAMCRGVPTERAGCRIALVDARKGDVFAGVYGPDSAEHVAPFVLARAAAASWIAEQWGRFGAGSVVGEAGAELGLGLGDALLRSELTDLPHAAAVALIALESDPDLSPAEPAYIREADAIRPNLPRSPLSSAEVE